MTHSDSELHLIAQMAEELPALGPVHLAIAAPALFELVALLQLATRHPGVSDRMRSRAEWFIAHAREHFAGCPAILEAIRRGADPANDRRAS